MELLLGYYSGLHPPPQVAPGVLEISPDPETSGF